MKISTEAQQLLDRYMLAFSRRLPFSSKKEICEELRSSLLDQLEETSQNGEISEKQMLQALTDLGAPGKLAASYGEAEYLVSPEIFPLFKLIFLIAAAVATIASVIQFAVFLASGETFEALLQIPKLVSSLAAVLGFTAVAFYLIEHFSEQTDWKKELYDKWSPDDLPEIGILKPISKTEQIVGIIFSLLLIIGVTGYGHRIGIYYATGDSCSFIPMLKEGFFNLLPILITRWSLSVVLAVSLLIANRERFKTSIFMIFLNCSDIALAIVFLSIGKEHFFNFEALARSPLSSLTPVLDGLYIALFVVIIVLSAYEIVKKIMELRNFTHLDR